MHELTFSPEKTYLIKKGQTIMEVCLFFDVSPYDLIKLNEMTCWKEMLVKIPSRKEIVPKWLELVTK